MTTRNLHIDIARLMDRINALGEIGALEGGGVSRLALTEEDGRGRDLVVGWMRALGLDVTVDGIGNVVGIRSGREGGPPVMMGSHIDTVRTGGLYDGCLGVLAGLEVVATLNDAGIDTRRPLAVAFFTNEEGARFAPDMMGSAVHQGSLDLDTALDTVGIDGERVADALEKIGYRGDTPCGAMRAAAFVELHVEQGPLLEEERVAIGAVEGVQGISWTEYTVTGVSNHAGTTPMRLRHDAGYLAARVAVEARALATQMGGDQVATVGLVDLKPNLVNVIPNEAVFTVDLRNTDEEKLRVAEARIAAFVERAAAEEGVVASARTLARFAPVAFDGAVVDLVARTAKDLGLSVRRMPSGAGHDAQMFAPNCPTGMVFVPSAGGISHNVTEYTAPEQVKAGADVLLNVVLELAG